MSSPASSFLVPLDYGVWWPLTEQPASVTSITFNTSTFGRSTFTRGSTTYSPSDDYVTALSNSNAGDVLGPASNTDYDSKFVYTPPRPFRLRKIAINIAMDMSVTYGTTGTVTFSSIQVIINKLRGTQNIELYNRTVSTGIAGVTASANQIFVFNDAVLVQAALTNIQAGDLLTCEVITVSSDGGDSTRKMGMLPWFPFYGSTNNKSLTQSAILFMGEIVPDA